MLLDVPTVAHTIAHRCEACGHDRAVPLIAMHISDSDMATPPCPTCLAHGLMTTEHFPRSHTAVDANDARHPESLTGLRLDGGGVVVEDTRFGSPPVRAEHVRRIRAMQSALGLPLTELPSPKA